MNSEYHTESFESEMRDQNEELFNLGKRGKSTTRRRKDRVTSGFIKEEIDEVAEVAKAVRKYAYEQLQSRIGKPGAPGKRRAPYSGARLGVNVAEHAMLFYLADHPENFPYADTTVEKLIVMYLILFSKLRLTSIADRMAKQVAGKSNSSQKHPVRHAVLPKSVTEEQVILAFKRLDFTREEWETFDPKKRFEPVGVSAADKESYRIRSGIWRDRSLRNPPKQEPMQTMATPWEAAAAGDGQWCTDPESWTPVVEDYTGIWDDTEAVALESFEDVLVSRIDDHDNSVHHHDVREIQMVMIQTPGRSKKRTVRKVLEASDHTMSIVEFLDVIEPEFAGVLIIPSVQVFVHALDQTFLFDLLVGSIITPKPGSIVTFKNRPLELCHTLVKGDEHATFSIRGVGIGGRRGKKKSENPGGRKKKRNQGITGNGAYNIKELKAELKNVAKGAVRTALSGGGRALGSHLGNVVGNREWGAGLGTLAGEKFARLILGKGDYEINNAPVSNSLINPGPVRGAPQFGSNVIRLRHREYFSDVLSSSTFTQTRYIVNPGNYTMFPFASQLARNYEKYKLKGAVITFNPEVSNYVGTSLMGKIVLACNENPFLPDYRNILQMENSSNAIVFKPDLSAIYGIECKRTTMEEYYVRRDDVAVPAAAIAQFDFGEFYVGVVTPGFTSGQVIGELWITYDIEFCMPRLSSTLFGYLHFSGFGATSTTTSMNFTQNDASTQSGALAVATINNTGNITLPSLPKDVAFSVVVTSATTLAAASWYAVGCPLASQYKDFESAAGVLDNQFAYSSPTGANLSTTQIYIADFITTSTTPCVINVVSSAAQAYTALDIKVTIINGTATTPIPGFG